MWYRRWIEVPKDLNGYDLTGARVTLKLYTSPNIMTLILYIDGRRSAMGEDLETTTLFDHAKPGDKALVAVKMSKTATPKTFARALLHIEPADGRPSPEDLHDEFIAAATLIPTVPDAARRQAELEQAIRSVDLNALHTGDQAKFDASLRKATSTLEPLRNCLQQETLVLNGQSHIDAAYRWPWTEAVDVVHRTFSTALQLMDEYPTYTFTQSSTVFNAWMADKYPIVDDEIKQRIKEGRWEIVGGMWVEGDFNLPGGESIVRQLLIGKRWYKQHMGSMSASVGTPTPSVSVGSCHKSTKKPVWISLSRTSLPGARPTSCPFISPGGSRLMAAEYLLTFLRTSPRPISASQGSPMPSELHTTKHQGLMR